MYQCLLRHLDAIDFARHTRTNLASLLVDARTAFDLVDREFLRLVVKHGAATVRRRRR